MIMIMTRCIFFNTLKTIFEKMLLNFDQVKCAEDQISNFQEKRCFLFTFPSVSLTIIMQQYVLLKMNRRHGDNHIPLNRRHGVKVMGSALGVRRTLPPPFS